MTSNRLKREEVAVTKDSAEKQTNPIKYVFVILLKRVIRV
jgi:hypothetical protein